MMFRSMLLLIAGLVLGIACTTAYFWWTGALDLNTVARGWNLASPPRTDLKPLPDTSAAAKYDANAPLPAPQPMTPPPINAERSDEADRLTPPLVELPVPPGKPPNSGQPAPLYEVPGELIERGLVLPVAGANPKEVLDTFNEMRVGHRHEAIDIVAPLGTPVLAVDEGNVVKLFHSNAGGITIYQFDDTQSWCYYYAHLDRYAKGLKEGMLVRKGEQIGYVGHTGDALAEAPHLHFTIFKLGPEKHWWQGEPINPFPILAAGAYRNLTSPPH
jgi:peptidoglycan LD-endopeptidase LytH